jgi:hypothetical protein
MRKYITIIGLVFCKKATELADKQLETKLSFPEKYALFMHKLSCKACRNYERQAFVIDSLLRERVNHSNYIKDVSPSTDFKLRIIQKIEKL